MRIVLLFPLVLLVSCDLVDLKPVDPEREDIDYVHWWPYPEFQSIHRGVVVVEDEETWQVNIDRWWHRPDDPPSFDFENHTLLVIAYGGWTCYWVGGGVSAIYRKDGIVYVKSEALQRVEPDCLAEQYPTFLVRLSKADVPDGSTYRFIGAVEGTR